MSITAETVTQIAHLARLSLSTDEVARYTEQLSKVLNFTEQMAEINTEHVPPLASPLNLTQRLRSDVVTETDQRAAFQAIAPLTKAGLYLVPKVIESE